MPAASFESVADRDSGLIRKPLRGAVLLGKYGTAAAITTLVATGGQINVPTGYDSVGWIGEDGVTFSKETETSDVRGWGSASFLRRDIRSEDRSVQFVALETKRLTKELVEGQDLSTNQISTAGELKIDIPDRPNTVYWRALIIGQDGSGSDLFYVGRVYHKVAVTSVDDETWSDGDDPLTYNITLSAFPDDTLGTLGSDFLFGPGVLALGTRMGYTLAS